MNHDIEPPSWRTRNLVPRSRPLEESHHATGIDPMLMRWRFPLFLAILAVVLASACI